MTKAIAIIQARMGSSRLPGKVLLDIGGRPMLQWVVERTRQANRLDAVLVATTTDPLDDPVAAFCEAQGYLCTRGSLHDVLDRYYQAALLHQPDAVVRITADCPFIDPGLIDALYMQFVTEKADFAANRLPPPWGRTYPIGLDTEICTFSGLATAWQEASEKYHREHVMPFFYENPQRFKIMIAHYAEDLGHLRWTVDTSEDLELARRIADLLKEDGKGLNFTWLDVLSLYMRYPELSQVNVNIEAKHFKLTDQRVDPSTASPIRTDPPPEKRSYK